MNTPIDLTEIKEKINEIEDKSANGEYIYRGEPERHEEPPHRGKVSSGLWRRFGIEAEHFDVEVVQREMLNDAKKHTGQLPQDLHVDSEASLNPTEEGTKEAINFEILTEIQHYGGETNLIDFTTGYFIALFFACDGVHDKDGRVILQETEKIRHMITRPRNPRHRVVAQKSVFVRPPRGFIQPHEDDLVVIPVHLKLDLLQYLRKYHDISTETVYNDLHGFIRYQGIHGGAYTQFYRGFASYDRGDKATTLITKQKEYEKSVEHYTRAIELKPDLVGAEYNRGLAHYHNAEYEPAIRDFSTTINYAPDDAKAYNDRGNAYRKLGKHDCAIQNYCKAIELQSDYAKAYYNRGLSYNDQARCDQAIQDFNKAIELKPDWAEAHNNRGLAFYHKREYILAIRDFSIAISIKPDHAGAYNNRGITHEKMGKRDSALKDYARTIELKPDWGHAYYNRGSMCLHVEDWKQAESDLTTAKNKGIDIVTTFHRRYANIADFEQKCGVKLPEDIVTLLQPT